MKLFAVFLLLSTLANAQAALVFVNSDNQVTFNDVVSATTRTVSIPCANDAKRERLLTRYNGWIKQADPGGWHWENRTCTMRYAEIKDDFLMVTTIESHACPKF